MSVKDERDVREGHIEWPDLERFPDIPVFNTKAVVQQTNIPAPTLRAWERRYTILSPARSGNAYRLYSERDVATIRWLKERIEAGMSISQAISLLRHLEAGWRQLREQEQAVTGGVPFFHVALPSSSPQPPSAEPEAGKQAPFAHADNGQWPALNEMEAAFVRYPPTLNMHAVLQSLLEAFNTLDETTAKALLASMLAIYPVEQVCAELIAPTLWEIGRLWEEGKLTVAVEHFASGIFRGVLTNLLYVTPTPPGLPLVLVCCSPGEAHELAVLMLALILRRAGMRVAYLGQSIEIEGLLHIIRQMNPAIVCVSLTMPAYMASLIDLGRRVQNLPAPRPHFVFGGQAFEQYAHLIPQVPGIYLHGDLQTITSGIRRLLSSRSESRN